MCLNIRCDGVKSFWVKIKQGLKSWKRQPPPLLTYHCYQHSKTVTSLQTVPSQYEQYVPVATVNRNSTGFTVPKYLLVHINWSITVAHTHYCFAVFFFSSSPSPSIKKNRLCFARVLLVVYNNRTLIYGEQKIVVFCLFTLTRLLISLVCLDLKYVRFWH
jgi:hypothetical protein